MMCITEGVISCEIVSDRIPVQEKHKAVLGYVPLPKRNPSDALEDCFK